MLHYANKDNRKSEFYMFTALYCTSGSSDLDMFFYHRLHSKRDKFFEKN